MAELEAGAAGDDFRREILDSGQDASDDAKSDDADTFSEDERRAAETGDAEDAMEDVGETTYLERISADKLKDINKNVDVKGDDDEKSRHHEIHDLEVRDTKISQGVDILENSNIANGEKRGDEFNVDVDRPSEEKKEENESLEDSLEVVHLQKEIESSVSDEVISKHSFEHHTSSTEVNGERKVEICKTSSTVSEVDKAGAPGKKGQLSISLLTEKMENEIFQQSPTKTGSEDKGLVTPPTGDKRRQKADEWLKKVVKSPEVAPSTTQPFKPADAKTKKEAPRNMSSWKQREEDVKKKREEDPASKKTSDIKTAKKDAPARGVANWKQREEEIKKRREEDLANKKALEEKKKKVEEERRAAREAARKQKEVDDVSRGETVDSSRSKTTDSHSSSTARKVSLTTTTTQASKKVPLISAEDESIKRKQALELRITPLNIDGLDKEELTKKKKVPTATLR